MYSGNLHDLSDCDACLMYVQHMEVHQEGENSEVNRPHTIADAIEHGRRLKQAEDSEMFSRHRSKISALQRKYEHEASLTAKLRDEAEALRVELEEVKDHLMAFQVAYEELAGGQFNPDETHDDGGHGSDNTGDDWQNEDSPMLRTTPAGKPQEERDNWTDEEDFEILPETKSIEEEDGDWFEVQQRRQRCPPPLSLTIIVNPPISRQGLVVYQDNSAPMSDPSLETEPSASVSAARRPSVLSRTSLPYSCLHDDPILLLSPRVSTLPEVFVNASAHGIGLIFDNKWLAWTFNTHHKSIPCGQDRKPIVSWAELIAVELGVRTLIAANYRNVSVIIRSDNEGVVQAVRLQKWIPKFGLHTILQRILRLCERGGIQLKVKWVWTKFNPANGPSRGVYTPLTGKVARSPDIPHELVGVIHDVVE